MKKNKQTRRTYYELTSAGFVFAGVVAFVLMAAVNSQTNILFWALGVVSGSLLLSAVLGSMLLKKLVVTRSVADHAIAGEPVEVQYRLANTKRFMPSCAVRVTEARHTGELATLPEGYCLHLGPGQSTYVTTFLVPKHRGVVELHEQRVCCSFPFGFINRAIHTVLPQKITVFPRIGMLSRGLLARSRTFSSAGSVSSPNRGGADEFYGMREYVAGDPLRSIHWRRSARTGKLVVRELTSDTPPTIIVVVDVRVWREMPEGRIKAEQAIELAAAWICRAMMDHFAVGMLIPGSSQPVPVMVTSGRPQRQVLLETLALLDLKKLNAGAIPPTTPPEHAAKRAEYVVVALSRAAASIDMVPAGNAYTLLCMDDPDSANWLQFPGGHGPQSSLYMIPESLNSVVVAVGEPSAVPVGKASETPAADKAVV